MRTQRLAVVGLLVITACGHNAPPLVNPQPPRPRILFQREFRLGTLPFGKIAGDTRELGTAIPAMLLTELRDGGRFAIYEGGSIRSAIYEGGSPRSAKLEFTKELPLNEANASDYVDGYLSGTLTSVSGQQTCLDLRLSNAVTQEVLYARTVCAAIASDGRVDRAAIKRLAEEIARAIKQVGNGKVISADGQLVFCDRGAQAGVSRGMVAYLVGTGDTVHDPAVHLEVQHYTGADPAQLATATTPIVVGEMYIVSVEDQYSVGVLYKGRYAIPDDTVFFK